MHIMSEEFQTAAPGDLISFEKIDLRNPAAHFVANEIAEGDEVYKRIIGKSYQENDNIGLQDLRYLRMLHYNFDHEL